MIRTLNQILFEELLGSKYIHEDLVMERAVVLVQTKYSIVGGVG